MYRYRFIPGKTFRSKQSHGYRVGYNVYKMYTLFVQVIYFEHAKNVCTDFYVNLLPEHI